ncbi:protein ENL isoform X2 [Clupea harengus]|uniref:Protein ENL isoform X2 n=1 Tax=Clupea harengus TaxID=7950 RepID=A0A6P8G326_CLUHA|nr:protein ENL isoform X2 [Clupea harengus]
MENQCTVQVKLELGHRAQLRKKVTTEGFTHDWMVFVRGPETGDIQHFVEKVVFRLHESFPKPKRVCKEPPYKVEESGYAGFLMPIEVYFKNKEEPKKVCFNYDLFLNLEGNPPVNHLRCEKLTFNNPTSEFRRKLIKAGGMQVVPEGAEAVSRPSPDYPMLPTIPLSAFSDPKIKTKSSHGSKDPSKEGGGGSKGPKPHKLTKEHRERQRKDSESKAVSKSEGDRDGVMSSSSSKSSREPPSSSSSSSSKKPSELKTKDEKVVPKAAFKEPKLTLKEAKLEGMSPKGGGAGAGGGGGGGGLPPDAKAPSKRPSAVESPKPSVKKQKKGGSDGPKSSGGGAFTGTSPRVSSSSIAPPPYTEKKPPKEKGRWAKSKSDAPEVKEPKKLPESDDSNSEDEASSKSESAPSSPSNSSSSSDSSSDSDFEPVQKQGQGEPQGPLRSMVEDLQSEESDDDDSSSEEETPVKNNPANRDSRLSMDSESDSSDGPHRPNREPPPQPQKHSSSINKVSGRKSPDPCCRPEKVLKKGYDKAYTEELVDLHRRLMDLRERNVLQQIVNLIEETGHFNVTNTTFDFDLFSLDESTVRKLQRYLEATPT